MRISDLCSYIKEKYSIIGDDRSIDIKFVPINSDCELGITFCDHPNISNQLTKRPLDILDIIPPGKPDITPSVNRVIDSKVSVIICPNELSFLKSDNKSLIFVENPRLTFMNLVSIFHPEEPFIHPTAVIDDCVEIGQNVSIGACSVIGGSGFGMWRMKSGEFRQFPQIGGVIIEDNVIIKANVCIDRGALGDTIIGEGSRIDNLCHIAHNCKIGKNVSIVATCIIGGSVEIGDNSWIAPNASILNGIKIGKNCVVGMGSVVLKDVPDNTTVKGVPAK